MFLSQLPPLILASIDDSCLKQLLIWSLPNGDFLIPPFLPHVSYLFVGILLERDFLFSTFTYLSVRLCTSARIHEFLFQLMGYHVPIAINFEAPNVPDLASKRSKTKYCPDLLITSQVISSSEIPFTEVKIDCAFELHNVPKYNKCVGKGSAT